MRSTASLLSFNPMCSECIFVVSREVCPSKTLFDWTLTQVNAQWGLKLALNTPTMKIRSATQMMTFRRHVRLQELVFRKYKLLKTRLVMYFKLIGILTDFHSRLSKSPQINLVHRQKKLRLGKGRNFTH